MIKNNRKKGLVSVVMSVYNGGEYLIEAIQSILDQTYSNIEFIIINDGSIDNSLEVIQKFASEDNRIILISRENKGLIASLNEAISLAKGQYIARMDADDISVKNRLFKQVKFLEANTDIGVVSCNVWYFDSLKINHPWPFYNQFDEDIRALIPFHSPIVHAAVMIRSEVLFKTPYNKNYSYAEDYKLWIDLAAKVKFYNLKEKLYKIRQHDSKVSVKYNETQVDNSLKVIKEYLEGEGVFIWNEELHKSIITTFYRENKLNLFQLFRYLDQLKVGINTLAFEKKANWMKAIYMVNNINVPFMFVFYVLLFHTKSVFELSFKQFLSLTKRSFFNGNTSFNSVN